MLKITGGNIVTTKALVLTLFGAIMVAGCGADQANRSSRQDNVSKSALAAGLQVMQGRVLRKVEAYNEIAPTAASRYFIHPGLERDAVMEFDVGNLSSLTLSPRIGDLTGDCLGDPEAGVVEFSYSLDDNNSIRFPVDRNYDDVLVVDLVGSKKMTIAVNHGNGVITCDWFGLGFLNVRSG